MLQLTKNVRTKLRRAVNTRFFLRYHPIFSLKNWRQVYGVQRNPDVESILSLEDFKFDFVFELMLVLWPVQRNLKTIEVLCQEVDFLDGDIPASMREKDKAYLREKHFELIKKVLWKKIYNLCTIVALEITGDGTLQETHESAPASYESPRSKRKRHDQNELMSGIGFDSPTMQEDAPSSASTPSHTQATAAEVVAAEIEAYKELVNSEPSSPVYSNLMVWWAAPDMARNYPCMSLVAGAIFSMLAGSGGLECDIGGIGDVITSKRSCIDPGMVEATMMIKLNEKYREHDPSKVKDLGKRGYMDHIPSRPEVPVGYYDDEETFEVGEGQVEEPAGETAGGREAAEDAETLRSSDSGSESD
jgi:hypothetical protein